MRRRLGDGNFRHVPSTTDGEDWREELLDDVMGSDMRPAVDRPRNRKLRRDRTPLMDRHGGRWGR